MPCSTAGPSAGPSRRARGPLVMPFSNVRHLGFRDKIRATRLAGFGQLSLHPHETRDTIKGGIRPDDMLEIAAEHDVAITRLDPLSNWNPRLAGHRRVSADRDRADLGRHGRAATGESGGVLAAQRRSQRGRDRCPIFGVAARSARRRERRILTRRQAIARGASLPAATGIDDLISQLPADRATAQR